MNFGKLECKTSIGHQDISGLTFPQLFDKCKMTFP